jgi:hypothetical protein
MLGHNFFTNWFIKNFYKQVFKSDMCSLIFLFFFFFFFKKKNPIKKEKKKKVPTFRFVINFHPNNLYEIFVDADEVLGLFLRVLTTYVLYVIPFILFRKNFKKIIKTYSYQISYI